MRDDYTPIYTPEEAFLVASGQFGAQLIAIPSGGVCTMIWPKRDDKANAVARDRAHFLRRLRVASADFAFATIKRDARRTALCATVQQ